jgi:hypothetical protein
MKKLALACLVVGGLSQAAGCIITSSSEEYAQFDVVWSMSLANNIVGCADVGAVAIEVVSEHTATGAQYTDEVPCSATGLLTRALPLGNYRVWVRAWDANDVFLGQSAAQEVRLELHNSVVLLGEFGVVLDMGWLDVAWNVDPNCGSGVTAEVVSELEGGITYIDLYDCVDGDGITAPLPAGDYLLWVNILDVGDNRIAQSFYDRVTVSPNTTTVVEEFYILRDEAFFYASWELVDQNDSPLTCAQFGADGVSILATLVGPNTATDDIFDCVDGEGYTEPLPLGEYEIVVYLLDDNVVLGESMGQTASLLWGNQVEDLGHFIFEDDGT